MDTKTYRIYVCANVHCRANGSAGIQQALAQELWALGLGDQVEVLVGGCQSQCERGPNIKIWPGPYHYLGVTPAMVRQIVASHLRDGLPLCEPTPGFRQ